MRLPAAKRPMAAATPTLRLRDLERVGNVVPYSVLVFIETPH
jgi:hypothetical protein